MTLQHDAAELFGLAGTLPRPAWVVLDAARDHRFTGELVFHIDDRVHVYFDRGDIYLAETGSDPSLGARLVDAGALNAAQLERGALHFGGAEHLGRLFERVPSVDRQFVVLVTEMMNEACVTELARQQVRAVDSVPYRHHPAGVHHWFEHPTTRLHPGDPLPAPDPEMRPLTAEPPESLFDSTSNDTDPLVHWDERSWLDDGLATSPTKMPDVPADDGPGWIDTDWTARLESSGLPTPEDDPLAAPTPLPPMSSVGPVDRFELIWPSGDVDDDFDSTGAVDVDDRDRVGPTARIARRSPVDGSRSTSSATIGADQTWQAPSVPPPPPAPTAVPEMPEAPEAFDGTTHADITLEVRRAVASVDVGSLDARRRLADAAPSGAATSSVWSAHGSDATSRSVFDDLASEPRPAATTPPVDGSTAPLAAPPEPTVDVDEPDTDSVEPPRVSALRRLIGGLRRR